MKILLDENLPESLLAALRNFGHQVDSINHLKLKGLDNGTLYRQVAKNYDLCFTRDAGFAHNVRQMRDQFQVKVLRVIVPNNGSSCLFLLSSMLSEDLIGRVTPTAPTGPDRT